MKRLYLASPYSDPNPYIMEFRYQAVCKKAGELMQQGYAVYSPIAHSHAIGLTLDNSVDHEFWLRQCFAMLDWADEIVVWMIGGWKESHGIQMEIDECAKLGIPGRYLREKEVY